jgi:ABC-type branched-subunit amino acid transport system substrate-binding protein
MFYLFVLIGLLTHCSAQTTSIVLGGIFAMTSNDRTPNDEGIFLAEVFRCSIKLLNKRYNVDYAYNIQDSSNLLSKTFEAATELIHKGSSVILNGPGDSDSIEVVGKLLSDKGRIPYLTISSTSDSFSDRNTFKTLFRLAPTQRDHFEAIVKTLKHNEWNLISTLFCDDRGSSSKDSFISAAKKEDLHVVCNENTNIFTKVDTASAESVKAYLKCLSEKRVNTVFLYGGTETIIQVLNGMLNMMNRESQSKITFISTGELLDVYFQSVLPKADGMRFLTDGSVSIVPRLGNISTVLECLSTQHPILDHAVPKYERFWENRLECKPPILKSNEAIKSSEAEACKADRRKCRCTSEALKKNWHPFISAGYLFDAIHLVYRAMGTNGTLRSNLQDISFQGTTGEITFNGTERLKSQFDIIQLQDGYSTTLLGSYSKQGMSFDKSALKFKQYSTPNPFRPISNRFSDIPSVILNTLSLLGILACVILLAYFQKNKENVVMKQSSRVISQIILIGMILTYCAMIIWSLEPTTLSCVSLTWIACIGISLIFSHIIAKTFRIWRIFYYKKSVKILDVDLLKVTFSSLLLEIVVLCCWTFIDGLPLIVPIQAPDDNSIVYLRCGSNESFVKTVLLYVLVGYNGLLFIGASFLAYKVRNVDSAFNESKQIAVVMYSIIFSILFVLPIYYNVNAYDVSMQFQIISITVFVCLLAILFSLFFSKVSEVKKNQSKRYSK